MFYYFLEIGLENRLILKGLPMVRYSWVIMETPHSLLCYWISTVWDIFILKRFSELLYCRKIKKLKIHQCKVTFIHTCTTHGIRSWEINIMTKPLIGGRVLSLIAPDTTSPPPPHQCNLHVDGAATAPPVPRASADIAHSTMRTICDIATYVYITTTNRIV